MGKSILVLLLLLGIPPTFAHASEDHCLQKCSIAADMNGQQEVRCSCAGKSRGKYFSGFSSESIQAVKSGFCKARVEENSFERRNLQEAQNVFSISNLSLCECVENRVRVPLTKTCHESQAGEKFCEYSLKHRLPAKKPIRTISLLDFQACEAQKNNYRSPASCRNSVCRTSMPACSLGYELSNLAENGSCCPQFVCKKKAAKK